jgi:hypothetical protein
MTSVYNYIKNDFNNSVLNKCEIGIALLFIADHIKNIGVILMK